MRRHLSVLLFALSVWIPHDAAADAGGLVTRIDWVDNMLTIHAPDVPGRQIEVWYLEAFCRTGSTDRVWNETVIPHETRLVERSEDGARIVLESRVEPSVVVHHEITVVADGVAFALTATNESDAPVDVDWAQPCMRVGVFSGLGQEEYHKRCFIFTEDGMKMLHELPRTVEARYKGGQVYVPEGIDIEDVNPRPIATVKPVNRLIGCISEDDQWLVAMAWEPTQELFQGVIKCIHNDFRIGGLKGGETKRINGKIYLLPNNVETLLQHYEKDFD